MRQFKKVETFTLSQKFSTQVYLREISRIPIMSPDEEFEIATQAFNGNAQAREKLVTANLRFVLSVAKMYASNEESQQEMVSVGNVGLVDAADRFDPTKGFRFISFAVWHIRKEMILYIQKFKRTVYVPPNQLQLVKKAEDARYYLFARKMEVFEYMKEELKKENLTFDTFKFVTGQNFGHVSLDKPLDTAEDSNLYEIIDSGEDTPEDVWNKDEEQVIVGKLLRTLTPLEKDIVTLHHGVGCDYPLTYVEIGLKFGISKQKAEIIHRKAITKMKSGARRIQFEPSL